MSRDVSHYIRLDMNHENPHFSHFLYRMNHDRNNEIRFIAFHVMCNIARNVVAWNRFSKGIEIYVSSAESWQLHTSSQNQENIF